MDPNTIKIGFEIIKELFEGLKKIDFSEISDLFKSEKFEKGKFIGELEPIYITLIAPRGAGKTSLLATILKYMIDEVSSDKDFSVQPCEQEDADRMSKFHEKLETDIKAGQFDFTSEGDPTADINKFEFELNFTGVKDAIFTQKFIVMDIPGGIINENKKNSEFLEHFEKSRILWIPVEAIALMEGLQGSAKAIKGREKVLCTHIMGDRLKDWAKRRLNKKYEQCSVNFVILKSETYFSHRDNEELPAKVELSFNSEYKSIISDIHIINSDINMYYVPVETIGVIKKYTSEWDDDGKLKCIYKFDANATQVDIKGVDRLMYNVLDYCHESLTTKLNKANTEINNYVDSLDKEGALFKLFHKGVIDEAKKLQLQVHTFIEGIEPLRKKLADLKHPTEFSKKYFRML